MKAVAPLSLLFVCLCAISASTGPDGFHPAIWIHAWNGEAAWREVLWQIRLPRTLLAAVAGAVLGLAGAALQGFTRNPLAESGVLGISASASLGAVLAFYTGFHAAFAPALPMSGMLGAALGAIIVITISGRGDSSVLILAGVATAALCAAATSLVLNLSTNPYASMEIVFWLMGSLQDRSWPDLQLVLPFILPGLVLLVLAGPALRALSLGEEAAESLGYDMRKLRRLIVGGTALSVGPLTAVTGGIGFVGLVVPHMLRPLVASDPAKLLPLSALGGSILVLAADTLLRYLPTDNELRIGVLTSLIGAPFFLWLVVRMRKAFP